MIRARDIEAHAEIDGIEKKFVAAAAEEPALQRLTQFDFDICCQKARRGAAFDTVMAEAHHRAKHPTGETRGGWNRKRKRSA